MPQTSPSLRERVVEEIRELLLADDPSPGDLEAIADAILALPEIQEALELRAAVQSPDEFLADKLG